MAAGFVEFVRAVHGHDPFPWQVRAAEALCAGEIPEAISVPTGTGKTSILDAAIFAMSKGRLARRVAYTVDRRLVVDGVSEHAQRVVAALARRDHEAVKAVADGLGGTLRVVRLRGGVPLDDEWALHPEDPCILVTTVDQAGSRLLFRGYGVSPRQAPIHAALLGYDVLHVLDEAHLSQAYLQTLKACRRLGAKIDVIAMTATPAADAARVLALDEEDRSHPVLARRLRASKRARLVTTTAAKLGSALVKEALDRRKAGAAVVGVVVNTVGRAREVFEALRSVAEAILLTGRVRPYERDELVEALLPAIRAGRDRSAARPLFVVATQTIEVGADLDFDALVSECASVSALRQRFGRLDRLGVAGVSEAAVVYAARSDKVYGDAYESAWKWMQEVSSDSVLDFGLEAFACYPSPPVETSLPIPPLANAHVQLLACTGIAAPQIDIAPWLHGIERASAEVSLVWRADLDVEASKDWARVVALLPPMAGEALNLPIQAARRWLQGEEGGDVADIALPQADDRSRAAGRPLLRWDGEQGVLIDVRDIRSGDTLVVPASYGGCDQMGWNPAFQGAVRDFGELVREASGRPRRRRIHPALDPDPSLLERAQDYARFLQFQPEDLEIELEAFELQVSDAERELLECFGETGPIALDPYPSGLGVVARRIGPEFGQVLETGVPVLLSEHSEGVASWARDLAAQLGADSQLFEDAGRLHDHGKRVEAFQAMLHGSMVYSEHLAKSGLTGSAAIAAWKSSGLPRGFRHEAASVSLSGVDRPILRHLVGVHHGYGRPWYPVCEDPSMPGSELAHLGGQWLAQFARLQAGEGPWVLAWLEMVLRVADARRSIEEQER